MSKIEQCPVRGGGERCAYPDCLSLVDPGECSFPWRDNSLGCRMELPAQGIGAGLSPAKVCRRMQSESEKNKRVQGFVLAAAIRTVCGYTPDECRALRFFLKNRD